MEKAENLNGMCVWNIHSKQTYYGQTETTRLWVKARYGLKMVGELALLTAS
ncbi:MAG: hypothetical protein KC456_08595 [Flavobacteriales bacterium]|nr:hypothetical protein [Flavobacteriales bacterium]